MNYEDIRFTTLGGRPSPESPRDIQLGTVQAPQPYPDTFLPDISELPIYDQGAQPACGGHAGAWFKSFLDYKLLGKPFPRSPRFVYSICKRDDGIPNDEGTYLRQIFATLKNVGACSLDLWPNDVQLSKPVYRDASLISHTAMDDAALNETQPYAFSPTTFEGLKQAIYQNVAVILLLNLDEQWWQNSNGLRSETETDILPVRPPKQVLSGHFVVAYGYDKDHIYFANSFGKQWGRNGIGYFRADYIPSIREAGTAVDIPNWQLIGLTSKSAIIRTILTKLIELLTKLVAAKVGTSAPSP